MFRNFVKRIGLVALVGLAWWWLSRDQREERSGQIEPEITVPLFDDEEPITDKLPPVESIEPVEEPVVEIEDAKVEEAAPSKPDDLTVLDGIGPKISGVLQSAGVTTYSQIAEMDTSQIEKILDEAQIRLARFDNWPEQAKFAAAGDWEGFKEFLKAYKAENS
jgi:predicted flap endonuclease-1-like 5' DNA nuclease